MRFTFFLFLLLSSFNAISQSGQYGIGVACVYQRWNQNFTVAPIVSVGVNKTLFSFSSTMTRGRGKKLSSISGTDWSVNGQSMRTITVGHFFEPEEDLALWIVPSIGISMVSEILQTNLGWCHGQPKVVPAFRIEVRHSSEKNGLGYWLGFGNIENGSIGITWKYKK